MLNLVTPEPLVDGLQIARDMQRIHDRQNAERANPKPIELKPLPKITDWHEAREALLNFQLLPDASATLADAHERQFNLCQEISRYEKILSSNPTTGEVRSICGYDVKSFTLPAEPQQYKHFDGLMELARAALADLERQLPLLQRKAALYEQKKAQLADWPTHRIDRERNKEAERRLIASGKAVEPRFW